MTPVLGSLASFRIGIVIRSLQFEYDQLNSWVSAEPTLTGAIELVGVNPEYQSDYTKKDQIK